MTKAKRKAELARMILAVKEGITNELLAFEYYWKLATSGSDAESEYMACVTDCESRLSTLRNHLKWLERKV